MQRPHLVSLPQQAFAFTQNLPIPPTPLIGREQETARACALLQRPEVRLLTLTGPAGVGKTRLALQVATDLFDSFADGVHFVPLAPIRDPDLVLPTIAHILELREVGGQTFLALLKACLHDRHLLLVLDNFEQVVTAAPLLAELLEVCPALKLLVTSREVLHLRAEHQFPIPPLAFPDLQHPSQGNVLEQYPAIDLFIQRAQAINPDFSVTNANMPTVAGICARLDGLPLAIELAAVRIKLLGPQALLKRLDQRLAVLTSGNQDVPVRQQTLRNTIAWSYQLLAVAEQRLFRCLSVFVGGCTLQAAEAICSAEGATSDGRGSPVLDGVASLIDKSLLQQMEQEGEEPRLVMLETIREYGREALAASGEAEFIQQAHARYYLALAEQVRPELDGPEQAVWLWRLEREHANLREALEWALQAREEGQGREMALRLGIALLRFWNRRGHWNEGRAFLKRALEETQAVAPFLRAKALQESSVLNVRLGNFDEAEALCQESLILYQELGDSENIARSLELLGTIAGGQCNFPLAHSLTEQSLTFFRKAGNKERIYQPLHNLGIVTCIQGDYAQGLMLLEESLALAREVDRQDMRALSLSSIAGMLFESQGDQSAIHALYTESLHLSRELEDKALIIDCLTGLGKLAYKQEDAATARSLLQEGLALAQEIEHRWVLPEILIALAHVEARQGDHALAHSLFKESLAMARKWGYKDLLALELEGVAGFVHEQPVWAAKLWGAAEALRESIGSPLPPVYRADYERLVATARTTLGEHAFSKAWGEGRLMTPEQALILASQVTVPPASQREPQAAPAARSSPANPAGLTAREVEVLRLVAQGLTDVQVAEQLVISPRTVNTHVKSIYGKIGVTSRSAATRYAMLHQLL